MPCIVFLLTVLKQCDATEGQTNMTETVSCQENEYLHTGFCCDKCSPGYKLKEKCLGVGQRSKCEKCSPGTYQDHMNHFKNCFSCREPCDSASKEIEIAQCTHMQDRVCGCQKGYYKNVLNEITMSCEPCRKCGVGEREIGPCEGEKNTGCDCKYNHYRVAKGICAQCTNCTDVCSELCPHIDKTTSPTPGPHFSPWIILCILLAVGLVFNFLVCIAKKQYKKRTSTSFSQSRGSCDLEKQVEKKETHTGLLSKENESVQVACPPDSVLPDCVPKEIKTHEFIYFVLDAVPVSRFKELARRLNISEQYIERAERDNRAFADAQYQMMLFWAGSGTKGGKSVLSRTRLQECVNTLKDMNLADCAESIEEAYA